VLDLPRRSIANTTCEGSPYPNGRGRRFIWNSNQDLLKEHFTKGSNFVLDRRTKQLASLFLNVLRGPELCYRSVYRYFARIQIFRATLLNVH
jgi:hypothetical protein